MVDFASRVVAGIFLSFVLLTGAAFAQATDRVVAIGVLRIGSPPDTLIDSFISGLRELGWIEGRNVRFEYRWAAGREERLPGLARDLATHPVDLIVVAGGPAVRAMTHATKTIPIVVPTTTDPVRLGYAKSLAKPGGNLTGFASQYDALPGKWLELLKEFVPSLGRVAVLWDPDSDSGQSKAFTEASRTLAVGVELVAIRAPSDVDRAFAEARRNRIDALVVAGSAYLYTLRSRIVALADEDRVPVVYHTREFVTESHGLMSYGPDLADQFRRAATLADRILRGAKPGDLPFEQPTKFELVVNPGAARRIGLALPHSLIWRADQVVR